MKMSTAGAAAVFGADFSTSVSVDSLANGHGSMRSSVYIAAAFGVDASTSAVADFAVQRAVFEVSSGCSSEGWFELYEKVPEASKGCDFCVKGGTLPRFQGAPGASATAPQWWQA